MYIYFFVTLGGKNLYFPGCEEKMLYKIIDCNHLGLIFFMCPLCFFLTDYTK